MSFENVQTCMREQRIDAWLLYDFRGSNPVLERLLPGKRVTTRRLVLLVPAIGEPLLLTHGLDANQFESLPMRREQYLSWEDFRDWLAARLAGMTRVALEYAPGGALPVVSIVDAGTVELVRSLGLEVASSANLIQLSVATWSHAAIEWHVAVSRKVGQIKDEAFALIGRKIADSQTPHEHEVQQFIMTEFSKAGLETPDEPIVAAGAHSGDPHYSPSAERPTVIRRGDWVLIDLWARKPGEENIFSDITWVGFAGQSPSPRQQEVFDAVRRARDVAVERAQAAFRSGERVQGWQLDEAARKVLIESGFGGYIRHRTGHSLSPGRHVHGLGVNLDNLETHDTREVLPRLGFTVEPGLYLPDFGVRLEINVYVDPRQGPLVTSPIQNEIIRID
jgi:Xaa-Pro aminopeptidase